MIKKDKNSADGKTADKAMHGPQEARDEEISGDLGPNEKVLEEVAAEAGNESPLREGSMQEKSGRSSSEKEIRSHKM